MVLTRAKSKATPQERPQAPFRILDLPAELLGNICDHLPDLDLINLRRVCRALDAHSSTAFGQRFFHHLIAILHPTSLTTLYEISLHPVLSKYVHQVTVSGERFGHTIPLPEDDETNKDLQSSLEQSGMDTLILIEAFRGLKSLRVVQIDVKSFHRIEPEEEDKGVYCGRKQMFKEKTEDYDKHNRKRDDEEGANRVYTLVLQALQRAEVHDKVELRFEFWNTVYSSGEEISFLDLDSRSWKDYVSKQIRYVGVLGMIDFDWIQRLLSSATDLHQFEIRGDDHLLKLSHGPSGMFHWSGFRHIHIEDLYVHHDEWTAFLRLHAQTLEVVSLSCMSFPHGNGWSHSQSSKQCPVSNVCGSSDCSSKRPIHTRPWLSDAPLHSVEQVKDALSAMRRRPRTVFADHGLGGGGERYLYAVDFAIGNAAAMGETVYEDGQEDENDEEDMETDIETDIDDESEGENEGEDV